MISELQLLSGIDIPFPEAQVTIHQPTLKELAYLGEDNFFFAFQLLKFSKDILNTEDKKRLSNFDDFDILMQIVETKNKDSTLKDGCESMMTLLMLLFPNYNVQIINKQIVLVDKNEVKHFINKKNYQKFREILANIFNLFDSIDLETDYNPSGALSQRIAEKLRARHRKLAEQKKDGKKISICNRYVSILAVGEHKDINSLMQYTMYQLMDEYRRFVLKMQYDIYLQAKMQGAKDLKEPEDWMKDIYEKDAQKVQDLIIK